MLIEQPMLIPAGCHMAMDKTNSNRALPMGAIGFAVNGVAFFNPFDMEGSEAVNILNRVTIMIKLRWGILGAASIARKNSLPHVTTLACISNSSPP